MDRFVVFSLLLLACVSSPVAPLGALITFDKTTPAPWNAAYVQQSPQSSPMAPPYEKVIIYKTTPTPMTSSDIQQQQNPQSSHVSPSAAQITNYVATPTLRNDAEIQQEKNPHSSPVSPRAAQITIYKTTPTPWNAANIQQSPQSSALYNQQQQQNPQSSALPSPRPYATTSQEASVGGKVNWTAIIVGSVLGFLLLLLCIVLLVFRASQVSMSSVSSDPSAHSFSTPSPQRATASRSRTPENDSSASQEGEYYSASRLQLMFGNEDEPGPSRTATIPDMHPNVIPKAVIPEGYYNEGSTPPTTVVRNMESLRNTPSPHPTTPDLSTITGTTKKLG